MSARAPRPSRNAPRAVGLATLVIASIVVPVFAVASLAGRAGLPRAISEEGDEVVRVWRILLAVASALGTLVMLLFVIALVRFGRRRRDLTAEERDAEPEQYAGSVRLEIVYTAIPAVIVAGIFVLALVADSRVERNLPPEVTVEATGFRWGWQFTYRDPTDGSAAKQVSGIAGDIPEIVLPVGRVVRFELRSSDVIHSFFVPELITKKDLIPGRVNTLQVRLEHEGRYRAHCAEFCGLDHARMNFSVRVVEPAAFLQWVAQQ